MSIIRDHDETQPLPEGTNLIVQVWVASRPIEITAHGANFINQDSGERSPGVSLAVIDTAAGCLKPQPLMILDLANCERLIRALQIALDRRKAAT